MDAIRMIGIVKCFGPVRANDGIDLIVGQQEIHCLLGENGTGKSTLMNILFGLYHPDAGEIFINEKKAAIANPNDAYALGIRRIVPQPEGKPEKGGGAGGTVRIQD